MNNEILIFLTEILIPIVTSGVFIYVVPIVTKFINNYQLNQAVKVAVESVEQYMSTAEGAVKKQTAKDYVLSKFLISDDELNILIEAAVFEINNYLN